VAAEKNLVAIDVPGRTSFPPIGDLNIAGDKAERWAVRQTVEQWR
jgi:hypothetical protein